MSEHESSNKKCALCGQLRPISQFLSTETSDHRTLFGTVCHVCLGREHKNLFNQAPRNKLQFEQNQFFDHFNDDDDDGSGGWDPEDRARTIRQLLTIDANTRRFFGNKKKQSEEKKKHEHKRKQEKLSKEQTDKLRDKLANEPHLFLTPELAGEDIEAPTTNRSSLSISKAPKNNLFQQHQDTLVKYTLTHTLDTTKDKTNTGTPPEKKQSPATTNETNTQTQEKTAKARDVSKNNPHIEATNKHLSEQHHQNEHISNSHQRLGQTLTFLSPFGMAGTDIRNKATRGLSASYMNKMFGHNPVAAAAEKRHQKDDEVNQEIKNSQLQETYEKAKKTFKK